MSKLSWIDQARNMVNRLIEEAEKATDTDMKLIQESKASAIQELLEKMGEHDND